MLPAHVAQHVDVVTRTDGGRSTVLVRPDGYLAWTGTDVGAAMAAWPGARAQRQPGRVGS